MKVIKSTFALSVGLLLAAVTFCAHAEVKLNPLFGDGMVLQQGVEVPVWGTANEGEKITIRFQDQAVTTTANHGRWMVRLKRLKAGGPFTMSISGENQITLKDVLIGEVWLASGQSNMAFALSRATNGQAAIATAADPKLRLFTVAHAAVDEPSAEVSGTWKPCTPQTAATFSAVAYFFGRDLRQALNVPVGLINSSVGGTPAQFWVSQQTLEADPELKGILDRYFASLKAYDSYIAGREQGSPTKPRKAPTAKISGTKAKAGSHGAGTRPSSLYNGMIAPLQPYAIAGVIWYQGEANSGRAAEYQKLFPALIGNWREAWHQGAFPFLFVQIAPEKRMSPEIREAQFLTSQRVPHTAMAVITDVGDADNIHPTQKEPVGHRLALAARALAYGEKLEYSGPVYKSMQVKGNQAILSFGHIGSGLEAKSGNLKGFTIAGDDGKFQEAAAHIEKDTIVVSSPTVEKPKVVHYGWASVPDVNLFNRDGLPASPFRTDVK